MGRRSALPRSDGIQVDGCVRVAAADGVSKPLLDERLAQIVGLNVPALRAKWASLLAALRPRVLAGDCLNLPPPIRNKPRSMAIWSRPQGGSCFKWPGFETNAETEPARRDRKAPLSAGSRLVREWHGRSYTVEVTAPGFHFAGQPYRSLSQVARTITGARWSGPRFFGL